MSPEGRSDTGGDSGAGAPLPACRRPSVRCCALAVLVGAALAAAVFFAAVWIGADAEVRTMRGAPGTAWLRPRRCARPWRIAGPPSRRSTSPRLPQRSRRCSPP